MATRCEICGKGPHSGRTYARRGLAKAKGGIGIKVTGKANRMIRANIQVLKLRDADGTVRRAHVCARCLRAGARLGSVTKAGARPRRWRSPEALARDQAAAAAATKAAAEAASQMKDQADAEREGEAADAVADAAAPKPADDESSDGPPEEA